MRKTILALGSAAVLSLSGAGIAAAQPTDPAPGADTAPTSPQTGAEGTDAAPTDSGSAAQMLCAVLGTPTDDDDAGTDTDTTDPATAGATGADAEATGADTTTYQDAATDENNLEGTETEQGDDTGVAGADPVEPATGDELGDALEEATGQETGGTETGNTGTGETGAGETAATDTEAPTATDPGAAALAGLAGPDCEVNVSELLTSLSSGDLDSASAVLSAEAPDEDTTPGATTDPTGATGGTTDEGTTSGAGDDQLDSDTLTNEDQTAGAGTY